MKTDFGSILYIYILITLVLCTFLFKSYYSYWKNVFIFELFLYFKSCFIYFFTHNIF